MFAPKKILIPTDFSECDGHCSMFAIKQAVDISKQHGSELVFLHVITEDIYKKPVFFLTEENIEGLKDKMQEFYEEKLDLLIEEYAPDQKDRCRKIVKEGKPYHEILNEAENNVDLIVIATRGLSGIQNVFYGSVTEKVVRHAKCSVLVVRKLLNDKS